jgi:hypothetical protein
MKRFLFTGLLDILSSTNDQSFVLATLYFELTATRTLDSILEMHSQ